METEATRDGPCCLHPRSRMASGMREYAAGKPIPQPAKQDALAAAGLSQIVGTPTADMPAPTKKRRNIIKPGLTRDRCPVFVFLLACAQPAAEHHTLVNKLLQSQKMRSSHTFAGHTEHEQHHMRDHRVRIQSLRDQRQQDRQATAKSVSNLAGEEVAHLK